MLWISIFLFLLISVFMRYKEGYYSDTNVSSAISSLNNVPATLTSLQTMIQGLESLPLDASDTLRSLNAILGSSDSSLDTNGVISNVRQRKNEVNDYQDNLIALSTALKGIKDTKISIKVGTETRTMSITDSIAMLLTQTTEITDKLRKIPDS